MRAAGWRFSLASAFLAGQLSSSFYGPRETPMARGGSATFLVSLVARMLEPRADVDRGARAIVRYGLLAFSSEAIELPHGTMAMEQGQ